MPKYLIKANYTLEGLKGVRAKGAKSRADAIDNMVNGMGGTVESFYFAFGDDDVYVVADLPDDESAAAVAFTVSAAGGATTSTVKLLTVEQADAALGLSVDYVPPGGSLGGPDRSRSGVSGGLERLESNSVPVPIFTNESRWPGRQEMARR